MGSVTIYTPQESGDIKFGDGINTTVLKVVDHKIVCSKGVAEMLIRLGHAARTPDPSWVKEKKPKEEDKGR